MNITSLKYILYVDKYKSISKAADKLFISQPTLSQHIKKLEENLSIELFDRSSSPISLTYAGEVFIKYALKVLNLKNELDQELEDIKNFKAGRITIGISSSQGNCILPFVLPKYKKEFPNIKINIIEKCAEELEELVEKGIVDFIILNLPIKNKNLSYEILFLDQLLIAIPENYLPKNIDKSIINKNNHFINEKIDIRLLNSCPFLLQYPNYRTRKIADAIFKENNIIPNIYLESVNIDSLYKMALNGTGVTFVPKSFIPQKVKV